MSGDNGDAVEVRLSEVRDAAGAEDAGLAQAREMELWGDVLRMIAAGAADAPELARQALRTLEVEFDRLAGGGGEAGTRVVVDLRITGSVRVRRETEADR
ncbi:MAG TPA: hypothetical protein VK458_23485 [Myxococcaceae bacterium]|jgi:hypothetical protein|nr:hypothetical protein [Longimicrobiaceae bacterium]HLM46855.1 hypothetical protein [Myxococcaceae bacterium]